MSEFYMKVAGVTFGGRQRTVARLKSGQELVFIPEPSNPYDNHAVGRMTVSESCRIMEKTPAFHAAGVVPTCAAISPTCSFTLVKSPPRFPMIPSTNSPLSHSVIASKILCIAYSFGKIRTGLPAEGSGSCPAGRYRRQP